MSNNKIIHSLLKMMNSSLIKDIYPMVDKIKITDINIDGDKRDNFMDIEIIVDSPDMDYHNMYDMDFDPHYLVDYHVRSMLPYLSIEIPNISFTVNSKDGHFIHSYGTGRGKNGRDPKFIEGDRRQNEAVQKLNKFFIKG